MMLKSLLHSACGHPLVMNQDLDSQESAQLRFRLINEKSFLNKFYQDCYISIAGSIPENVNGKILELGSGAGFIKNYLPDCVSSDVLQIPGLDLVLDGQRLPIRDDSLRGIVMLDVFHHLPRVQLFLEEASRCVRQGGVIVMIEPWNTPWSRFIYRHLHHEPFDDGCSGWEIPVGEALSKANQALPWIVFQRDRLLFERMFPHWHISKINLHSPFCYLLSGGLTYRSFMPGCLFKMWRGIEDKLRPCMPILAMFAEVVLLRENIK
jgi:SAM-dependent methyltransferase